MTDPAPAAPETVFRMRGLVLAPSPAAPQEPPGGAIDWVVSAGECWAVGGLHGSGKSALLATAALLQRPASGEYELFGRNTRDLGEQELIRERRRVGLVFEGGARLFHRLTVAENVALPLRYHRDCPLEDVAARVQALLAFGGLEGVAHEHPGRLPRRIRQRVGLVRALALAPEVLLVDNPVAGLDPRERASWLELLRQLAVGAPVLDGRPVTLVVAADHLSPWLDLARCFATLEKKHWRVYGSVAELRADQDPGLRELLAGETVMFRGDTTWLSKI